MRVPKRSDEGGRWNVRNLSNGRWVYEGGFDTETEAAIWLAHYLTLLPPERDQYAVRRMGATYSPAKPTGKGM